jgi:nucleoside-diphosphate-sugar epimerase
MLNWSKTPAIVTGGCGLIGSHVVDELVDQGAPLADEVIAYMAGLGYHVADTTSECPQWADVYFVNGG